MIATRHINQLHETAIRRMEIAKEALEEYKQAVDHALAEAEVEAKSRPLKVVEIAELVNKDPATIYRWGIRAGTTYAELWRFIRDHKPQLLRQIEMNYKRLRHG